MLLKIVFFNRLFFLFLILMFVHLYANAQNKSVVNIPTSQHVFISKQETSNPKTLVALKQAKEICNYVNLYNSIDCASKMNAILEDTIKKNMKKVTGETPYLLLINWDKCQLLYLKPATKDDKNYAPLVDEATTIYHLSIYPEIVRDPVIKKDEHQAAAAPILATYKNDEGKWIAMGPYLTTNEFDTENGAIGSLFYSGTDISFLCQRGKFRIYKLNTKVDHQANDIRYALKQLGVTDIPNQ